MPIFNYKCLKCDKTREVLIRGSADPEVRCECWEIMERQIPTTTSSITYETKDAYRGVQHRKGQKEMMTKRMRDHHDRYEVEEKIDKFGLDDAKKHGWLKKRKAL